MRSRLLSEQPGSPRMARLRCAIGECERARRLLAARGADLDTHVYRKRQGPHWTLYSLALIDYPPGDRSLLTMRDRVYEWLLESAHLRFPRSLAIPGQDDRFRRCASQEGNAIWYSLRLAIDDERTRELVARLIRWQLPDGGFPVEKATAQTSDAIVTRGTRADWGPSGKRRANPLATVAALAVLKAAAVAHGERSVD